MTQPAAGIRILLVEDSRDDADLLEFYLSSHGLRCEMKLVEDQEGFIAALAAGGWDLVISDFQLSDSNGLQILRHLRHKDPDLPFILLSGVLDEGAAVEAMRSGANDFLLKSNLSRLVPAIEREQRDYEIRRKRRAVEAELEMLHTAIGQTPDMVVITEPDGTIVYANPATEVTSGFTRDEMVGRNPRIFKSGQQDGKFYQAMWDTLLQGEIWHGRIVNLRKDGSRWDSMSVISPVFDVGGGLRNYLWTARDVTHEHELEVQLERNQRLETIGVLTSGIAHDFNNILMPVVSHAELGLGRPPSDPRLQNDLEVILASAQRAAALIRQILAFSRQDDQEVAPLELQSLLMESLKLLRATVPTSITFQVELEARNCLVAGDPTKLHQVILNLCVNAAHAMRGMAGRLTVRLKPVNFQSMPCTMGVTLAEGDHLRLEVSDTGRGILPEHLDRIFLPFFTTKPPKEGTGLGLSVTHAIVSALGGGIQVESRPGEGTVFTLFLPQVRAPIPDALCGEAAVVHGQARVLLVDDEELLLEALRDGLERLGFKVAGAKGPTEALAIFLRDPNLHDVLVTDFQMPHMTGRQLAEALWTLRPDLPVVVITGSALVNEEGRMGQGRFSAVLVKPLLVTEVARAIQDALEGMAPRSRSQGPKHCAEVKNG